MSGLAHCPPASNDNFLLTRTLSEKLFQQGTVCHCPCSHINSCSTKPSSAEGCRCLYSGLKPRTWGGGGAPTPARAIAVSLLPRAYSRQNGDKRQEHPESEVNLCSILKKNKIKRKSRKLTLSPHDFYPKHKPLL